MSHTSFPTRSILLIAALGVSVAGCANPWSTRGGESPIATSHTSPNLGGSAALSQQPPLRHSTVDTSLVKQAGAETTYLTRDAQIDQIVTEVRQELALTIADENELREKLQQCRIDEQPSVVKRFRSTLAYRQELLAREAQTASHPPSPLAKAPTTAHADPSFTPVSVAIDEISPLRSQVRPADYELSLSAKASAPPLPERGSTLANRSLEPRAVSPAREIQPASYAPAAEANSWNQHLAHAIQQLEATVPKEPGSTDEVADHMRLRMLHLMAGQNEAALETLPGASTAEQDFWSKQLFALSTYLDSDRQPDRKRRAAGTLTHLDQARSRLAEIASLQVSHLEFVSSVDGFGLYEPVENARFQPGEQVALYAEVENFRSESSQAGYRTSLATSYEVLDPQGRRVEGAQFPEVEDLCRNLRRDFHLQYGVILPKRIFPGEYELRLTITDQLSNKIAQSSLPFKIAE